MAAHARLVARLLESAWFRDFTSACNHRAWVAWWRVRLHAAAILYHWCGDTCCGGSHFFYYHFVVSASRPHYVVCG